MTIERIPPGIQVVTGCDDFKAAYVWTQGQSHCVTNNGQVIKVVPEAGNTLGESVPDNLGNISIDQRKVDQNLGTSDDYESFTLIDVSELKNRRPSGDGAVCDTSKEIRKVYKLTSALAGAKPMNPDEIATQVKRFEESSDLICAQSDGNSLGSLDATEITGYTTWSGYCVSIVYALGQQVATAVNGVSGYVTADKSQA